jgi:hypothetical protein
MVSIESDLYLPDSLRDELKQPYGQLMESYEILKKIKEEKPEKIVTIGDSVSSFFIRQDGNPDMIIWDGITKRHPLDDSTLELLSNFSEKTEAKNPPGMLSREAWDTITEKLSDRKASVFVKGEEDLLAIPVILNSEDGTYVVYGHPPGQGAILIVVDRKIKSLFQDILSRFESKSR